METLPNMISSADIQLSENTEICEVDGAGTDKKSQEVSQRRPGPASKTQYYEILEAQLGPFDVGVQRPNAPKKEIPWPLLPMPEKISIPPPKKGDIVFAFNGETLRMPWLQAQVLDLVNCNIRNQLEVVVRMEPTVDGYPTGGRKLDRAVQKTRQCCFREIALKCMSPYLLPVGCRVVAKYRDEFTSNPLFDGYYYAGVIGDMAKELTKRRYLVFFDDGFAQYVPPDEVFLVSKASQMVWNDIHPRNHDFIKSYVTKYPYWPRVKLFVGATLTVEWNGLYHVARVVEVDVDMVKVKYENYVCVDKYSGESLVIEEWIYRGSPRFVKFSCEHKLGLGLRPSKDDHLKADLIEFQGKLKELIIPSDSPKPREFLPHDCSQDCVIPYVPPPRDKAAARSPLSVPLFLGWTRELCEDEKRKKKIVVYTTPCGVRLEKARRLQKYLRKTISNIPIDCFNFNTVIDPTSEFIPSNVICSCPDISDGKESIPIPCVNGIDNNGIPELEYITESVFHSDVTVSSDQGFLVCCDCKDDCSDIEKCACRKLTRDSTITDMMFNYQVGYKHHRLNEYVLSGIYECNNNCKCQKSCANRLIQNGTIWPVQLFKTAYKGWAIRALFDIPDGTFLFTYPGEIMREEKAYELGTKHGDEYQAELNFIQCNEAKKAGYESEVTDIEEDLEEDSYEKPVERNTAKKSGTKQTISEVSCSIGNTENSSSGSGKYSTSSKGRIVSQNFVMDPAPKKKKTPNKTKKMKKQRIPFRKLYGPSEPESYVLEAKYKGNISRFLNHSCNPNVFVQNAFIQSHDIRFPVIAFFTKKHVKAGMELTWDYHYQIGAIDGKEVDCCCRDPNCRGRLL